MKPWTSLVLLALAGTPSLVPADTCQEAREDAVVYYNPRPFYYWGFIAGMWGGAMMSTPLNISFVHRYGPPGATGSKPPLSPSCQRHRRSPKLLS
ncbi:MAG: hypothetical protein ABIM74_03020 [candidate division WOR-3 bacterium]